jgi:hypothetical protein
MKRILIAAIAVFSLVAPAEAGKKWILKVPAFEIPVELEEIAPAPPIPPPPEPVTDWLTVKDGRVYAGTKKFTFFSYSMVGYSVVPLPSTDPAKYAARVPPYRAMMTKHLDYLASCKVNMIRILHFDSFIGSGTPMWFASDSTFKYDEQTLAALDWFISECGKRGIRVWPTFFHRRVLTAADGPETPYGTIKTWDEMFLAARPAGTHKGEIGPLAFFDDVLLRMLEVHQEALLNRVNTVTGKRWADDPTLAVWTLMNEKASGRNGKGYDEGSRNTLPIGYFKPHWFARWDDFKARTGVTKMTKPLLEKMYADLDYRCFGKLIASVKKTGCKALLNCSSLHGDERASQMLGQMAGDILDIHIYGPDRDDQPDPLHPQTDRTAHRTLGSVIAASRFRNMPVVVTEWASVYQQNSLRPDGPRKQTKSPSWPLAPAYVAKTFAEQDVTGGFQYAYSSYGLGSTNVNNDCYDANMDGDFLKQMEAAAPIAAGPSLPEVHYTITEPEIFGVGDTLAPVPGTQQWAKDLSQTNQVIVDLPEVKELPWLQRPLP